MTFVLKECNLRRLLSRRFLLLLFGLRRRGGGGLGGSRPGELVLVPTYLDMKVGEEDVVPF